MELPAHPGTQTTNKLLELTQHSSFGIELLVILPQSFCKFPIHGVLGFNAQCRHNMAFCCCYFEVSGFGLNQIIDAVVTISDDMDKDVMVVAVLLQLQTQNSQSISTPAKLFWEDLVVF